MKIKMDSSLYERAVRASVAAGYSSVDEFIAHVVETAIKQRDCIDDPEQQVADQLRGLGYIE